MCGWVFEHEEVCGVVEAKYVVHEIASIPTTSNDRLKGVSFGGMCVTPFIQPAPLH